MAEKKEQHSKWCENCLFSTDYSESDKYIKCERGKSKWVDKKQPACKNYADKR